MQKHRIDHHVLQGARKAAGGQLCAHMHVTDLTTAHTAYGVVCVFPTVQLQQHPDKAKLVCTYCRQCAQGVTQYRGLCSVHLARCCCVWQVVQRLQQVAAAAGTRAMCHPVTCKLICANSLRHQTPKQVDGGCGVARQSAAELAVLHHLCCRCCSSPTWGREQHMGQRALYAISAHIIAVTGAPYVASYGEHPC